MLPMLKKVDLFYKEYNVEVLNMFIISSMFFLHILKCCFYFIPLLMILFEQDLVKELITFDTVAWLVVAYEPHYKKTCL